MAKGPKKTPKPERTRQSYAELPPALNVKKLGRPTEYDPEYCDLVLEMGSAGKSKAQMAAGLGISRQTMTDWERKHPEFLDAVKAAQDLALAWWESAGQINMTRQGFNATAYIFQMKNRFRDDYRDVQSLEHSGRDGAPIEVTDTNKMELARWLAMKLAEAVADDVKTIDVSSG